MNNGIVTKDGNVRTFSYKGNHYKVEDLIEFTSNLPTQELKIDKLFLKNISTSKCWVKLKKGKDSDKVVVDNSPMNMYELVEHFKRAMNTDYTYPVCMHNNNILDGCHRIIHAAYDGKEHIDQHILTDKDMEKFIRLYQPYYDAVDSKNPKIPLNFSNK